MSKLQFNSLVEVSKEVSTDKRMTAWERGIERKQLQIAQKKIAKDRRIVNHNKMVTSTLTTRAKLQLNGIKPASNFDPCFEHFNEVLKDITAEFLSGLVDEKLQKDIDRCTTPEQEEIVTEWHAQKNDLILDDISYQRNFYENLGYSFDVEKVEKKKSGTRSRVKKQNA